MGNRLPPRPRQARHGEQPLQPGAVERAAAHQPVRFGDRRPREGTRDVRDRVARFDEPRREAPEREAGAPRLPHPARQPRLAVPRRQRDAQLARLAHFDERLAHAVDISDADAVFKKADSSAILAERRRVEGSAEAGRPERIMLR
ncbi:MAG: hypothetical protein RMM58_11700 [Chloroflexota bacterium]|nr:hypothetical protein [Dehalococcoidia bacterium]MDW8254529.1 hypothetical protein [Chloroflexota bacterium]